MLHIYGESTGRATVGERGVEDDQVAVQDVVGQVPAAVPVFLYVPINQYGASSGGAVVICGDHGCRPAEKQDSKHR